MAMTWIQQLPQEYQALLSDPVFVVLVLLAAFFALMTLKHLSSVAVYLAPAIAVSLALLVMYNRPETLQNETWPVVTAFYVKRFYEPFGRLAGKMIAELYA